MINPFLKTEWLREGRNIRLPLMIIFYIAIMAFIMILFMVFNEESFQQGYYYDTTTYQYQFLIISTFQIITVLLLTPFTVSRLFIVDKEKNMLEQFEMVPGVSFQYVTAKIILVLAVHVLLFISGLPVSALSCIYTGISGVKLLRLGAMIFLYAFWSGAISIFFYTVCSKSVWAFASTFFVQLMFGIGTLMLTEVFRNGSLMMSDTGRIAPEIVAVCLILLAFNPLSSYMGFYGSITGDIGIFGTFCSHLGIDTSDKWFILLFYKVSSLACVLVGVLFLSLSVWYMDRRRRT